MKRLFPAAYLAGRRRNRRGPSLPTSRPAKHLDMCAWPVSITSTCCRQEMCRIMRGRCTFKDDRGRRCAETGALEFDHLDGFAKTHSHQVDRIRLLCRGHNQHAADQTYGKEFMERARSSGSSTLPGIPGTSSQPTFL